MRICQILPQMNIGGVETGTLDLSGFLHRIGHHVVVISHGGVLVGRLTEQGIEHVTMPVHRKELFTILWTAWRVRRFCQKNGIDIVHARSRVPGWIAWLATRGTRTKFVTTAHGAYRPHFASRVMAWGQKVIVPSTAIWNYMTEKFGVAQDRLCLIHRGIDLSQFEVSVRQKIQPDGPIVVGMVGRITPLKGHETFLQALALARQKNPRITGKIVGDCPAKRPAIGENLIALAQRLGLTNSVVFENARPDVEKVYRELDILVMASLVPESFGRVLVEAQASGVPVIASALGGILDIVEDGRTGTLFAAGDALALAGAMGKVAGDPVGARRMSDAALTKARQEFAMEKMAGRTLDVYTDVLRPKNILVLKFSSLGDVLLSEPSLRALRRKYPDAHIGVVVKSSYRDALKNCPHVDELIEYDIRGRDRGPGFFGLVKKMNQGRFDLVVDLQNNWRSHALAYLANIPWRLGYARKGGRFLLNDVRVEPREKMDPVSHQFYLLSRLDVPADSKRVCFATGDEDTRWVEDFLRANRVSAKEPLVAVHVGGSPRWQSKQWGRESFAAFINGLGAGTGMRPVLVGGAGDIVLAERLKPLLRVASVDAVGKTSLGNLAALLKHCCVMVGADSAPLHVSWAVGTLFVALFGPTDPAKHAPPDRGVVISKAVPCGPCYKPVCPEGHHRCMKSIDPQEVLDAVCRAARGSAQARPCAEKAMTS